MPERPVDPQGDPQAEIERLRKIVQALMDRAERSTEVQGSNFSHFQAAVILEEQVQARTADLAAALRENEKITRALRESEARLRDNEARLRAVIQSHPSGMAIFDARRRLVIHNLRYQQLLSFPDELLARQEVRADDLLRYRHARGDFAEASLEEVLGEYLGRFKTRAPLHDLRTMPDGRVFEIDRVALPGGETLVSYSDVTTHARAEAHMRDLATHDALTRLPNRRLLVERIVETVAANRRGGQRAALMLIDLDQFKPLNDAHGHQAGDLLLVEVANRLRRCVRQVDTVARIGGDEFVIMLTGLPSTFEDAEAAAAGVAETLLAAVGTPFALNSPGRGRRRPIEHRCTCSIGVAPFDGAIEDPDVILWQADRAMYRAKRDGRNRIALHDPGVAEP